MLGYLSDEVMDALLTNQWFGRLACAVGDEVLVVPVTYLYDGHFIYGHTREGTKTRLMRQNPHICLEVDEIVSPTLWRSVVVRGVFEELTGDDRTWALQRLGQRQAPLFPDELPPIDPTDGEQQPVAPLPTVVYRIHITDKSGRSEQR